MELMITNQALDKLTELDSSRLMILALTYDTEGCGCGVNGMPTFALITKKQRNHIDVMCKDREVVVDKMESVFFAEKITLDYNGATFRLTSPNEMLNPFIHTNSVLIKA